MQQKRIQRTVFSERFSEIMEMHATNQEELAKATGLSQSAISRLLNSKYEPRSSDLIALSRYFAISVGWLLGLEAGGASDVGDPKQAVGKPVRHRVDARLLNEAAVRSLVKQLRKQADDLELTCNKLFNP